MVDVVAYREKEGRIAINALINSREQ